VELPWAYLGRIATINQLLCLRIAISVFQKEDITIILKESAETHEKLKGQLRQLSNKKCYDHYYSSWHY
jgi:hypothetical protein